MAAISLPVFFIDAATSEISDLSLHDACPILSARVADVTVLPVPTAAVSNVPVPLQVTTSVPTTPVSVQLIRLIYVESYVLFAALLADVNVAAVLFPVVVPVVAVRA